MDFDEVASRRIEATYLTPDVIEQRRLVVAALDLQPGERALDIGSGPGLLAADTYSAGLVGFVGAFVPGRHGLTEADVRAWADDLTSLGEDFFFSLNRYVFVGVKRVRDRTTTPRGGGFGRRRATFDVEWGVGDSYGHLRPTRRQLGARRPRSLSLEAAVVGQS